METIKLDFNDLGSVKAISHPLNRGSVLGRKAFSVAWIGVQAPPNIGEERVCEKPSLNIKYNGLAMHRKA